MLLFVLCRHVAIRGIIRILLGQVRNLLTSAKESGPRKNMGPRCAEISWQSWPSLEDSVHTAWYFWLPLQASAGYDPLALPWSFLFSSHPFPAPLWWFIFWIYACVIYKKSYSSDHSRNPERFVSLLVISQADFYFFFNLAPCPKEMNSLLWFLGLFLASFKTCLLIASEPLRQAQLHPPAPSLTFLGLVLMLLNPWQSETHCIFFE